MRISDWSSDVCSSDLPGIREGRRTVELFALEANIGDDVFLARIEDCFRLQFVKLARDRGHALDRQIGRASCRERVGQYVSISVDAVSLRQKKLSHQLDTNDVQITSDKVNTKA